MTTPKLQMPELVVGQAGKELTHNQALAVLDQLTQPTVVDKDLAAPPGSPANGSMYIVAAAATGAWSGQSGNLAVWLTTVGSWTFITPANGWSVWVIDEAKRYALISGSWSVASAGPNSAALDGLTGAADKLPYFTGAGALSVATLTAKARELLGAVDAAGMRTTLGLGSAAVAAVTTSAFDTTAGRVMKVGDFGLGASSNLVTADFNTLTVNGMYYGSGAIPGSPDGVNLWGVLHMGGGSVEHDFQIAYRISTNDVRTRYKTTNAGGWQPWQSLWTSTNLVKTTSATDTTAGSVLKVGDFGLGTDSQQTNIDPNTIKYGSIFAPVSQANAPAGECVIWSGGRSAGARAAQFAIDHGFTTRAWSRSCNVGMVGSEWGQWVEHWTSAGTNAITVDTGSLGYGIGSGGAVTQATSKATGVTLNKPSGQVTTAGNALAANSAVSFTLTNDKIAANDIPKIAIKSGATAGAYVVQVDAVVAGSCRISIRNLTGGSLSETLVLQFNIEKGATA